MRARVRSSRRGPVRARHGLPGWVSALGIAAVLGLAAGGGWAMWRQVRADAVDASLCPAAGAVGELAILLDMTDPLGATQSLNLRSALERMVVESPRGTLVALGRVSDDPGEWGAAYALCRPMTGAEGGEWTRNPTELDRRFQAGFLAPFEAELGGMLEAEEAKASPIMEGLQALLAGTRAAGVEVAGPRRIVIVSDLLQHSEAVSFYRGDDWESFRGSPAFGRLARNLGGAVVRVLRIPRAGARVDAGAVDDFWVRYLDAQGAGRVDVETLGDL
jgi:hypothetical protein